MVQFQKEIKIADIVKIFGHGMTKKKIHDLFVQYKAKYGAKSIKNTKSLTLLRKIKTEFGARGNKQEKRAKRYNKIPILSTLENDTETYIDNLFDDDFEKEITKISKSKNILSSINIPANLSTIEESYVKINAKLSKFMHKVFEQQKCGKICLCMRIEYTFPGKITGTLGGPLSQTIELKEAYIITKGVLITNTDELKILINQGGDMLKNSWETYNFYKSGAQLKKVITIGCIIYKMRTIRGGFYVETPAIFKNAKCGLINIRNTDNECFKWCLLYHISDKSKHCDRISVLSKIENKYNMSDVNYPTSLQDIDTFELNNKNTSIIILMYDENTNNVFQYRRSKNYNTTDKIYLFLHEEHYIYIKNIYHFLRINRDHKDYQICDFCLRSFKPANYEKHTKYCKMQHEDPNFNGSIIKMPKKGDTMKFKNFQNAIMRPYVIYLDFEASNIECKDVDYTQNSRKISKQVANSYAYKIVCCYDDSKSQPIYSYHGPNPAKHCIDNLLAVSRQLEQDMKIKRPCIPLTEYELESYNNATHCHICDKELNGDKVLDHCHFTGKYRGPAHNNCNLHYHLKTNEIPVICHNLRGYDSHLLISEFYNYNLKMSCIPNNPQKFMSFTLSILKFIDSQQFMNESLDSLCNNMITDNMEMFKYTSEYFKENTKLMARKGIYPYDYVKSDDVFGLGFPSIDKFDNKLTNSKCSQKDYEHAQNVYNTFKCKNFLDYHMLYLKSDVLILSDIFENFRKIMYKHYKLDASNYITAPGLAWDAMLKMTKIEIDLISDYDMLLFFERSKRGGLCFLGNQRHCIANNKYIKEMYDPTKPSTYIIYMDANALYADAMSKKLPYTKLKWCPDKTLEELLAHDCESDIGYMVECDISFPKEKHDYFSPYVPCPESIKFEYNDLSDYQKSCIAEKNYHPCEKLIPHLKTHKNYVMHLKNLQSSVKLGVKIDKIHRVVEFEQKAFMKDFIDFNTILRTKSAKNEFEIGLYKLMSNSVFGKTMQNVRKEVKITMISDIELTIKCISKPTFDHIYDINGLYLCQEHRLETLYNKPVYIGCSILDLSKITMLNFHYGYMKNKYEKLDLLYSDTDSLVYNIYCDDWYSDVLENMNNGEKSIDENTNSALFDLSSMYSNDLKMTSNNNKKVPSKFKDETNGVPIVEFIALNPKCYSYSLYNPLTNQLNTEITKKNETVLHDKDKIKLYEQEYKKSKGVSKTVVKNDISIQDYKNVFETGKTLPKTTMGLRSYNHEIYLIQMEKQSLSIFYDKMYMIDSNNCVPFGYQF